MRIIHTILVQKRTRVAQLTQPRLIAMENAGQHRIVMHAVPLMEIIQQPRVIRRLMQNISQLFNTPLLRGTFAIKLINIIKSSYMSKTQIDSCNTTSIAKTILKILHFPKNKVNKPCKNPPSTSTSTSKTSNSRSRNNPMRDSVNGIAYNTIPTRKPKQQSRPHPPQLHTTHSCAVKHDNPERLQNKSDCSAAKCDNPGRRMHNKPNFYNQKHLVYDSYGHNENHLKLLLDLLLKDGPIDPTTIRRCNQLGYDYDEISKVLLFVNELKLTNNLHLACMRTKNLHQNTLIPTPLSKLITNIMKEHHNLTIKTMDERLLSVQPDVVCKLVTRSCDDNQDYLLQETIANDNSLVDKKDLLHKVIELSNYIHNNMDMTEFVSTLYTSESYKMLPLNSLETICDLSNRIHEEPLSAASIGLLVSQLLQHKITNTVEYPHHT